MVPRTAADAALPHSGAACRHCSCVPDVWSFSHAELILPLEIGTYRGRGSVTVEMCECSKVHLYEVEFKLGGMVVVPTHKNCGAALNQKQADTFQKELVKSWGLPDDDE